MRLRDLLEERMGKDRWRVSDIAKILDRSIPTISITLDRDIDNLRISTLRKYCEVLGLNCDFKKMIYSKN